MYSSPPDVIFRSILFSVLYDPSLKEWSEYVLQNSGDSISEITLSSPRDVRPTKFNTPAPNERYQGLHAVSTMISNDVFDRCRMVG
jgi:hypothetical protein